MNNNLRIGLTMRVVETAGYQETRDALAWLWQSFMSTTLPKALWMPVPNLAREIISYIQDWQLNGFIITGGNDLFEYPHRDETELALLEYALKNDLPVLGVCRGLQIMAHFFGYKITPCRGHAGTRHEVNMSQCSLTVNSYHNICGPSEIESPLVPFAWDKEGRIEGFYHQDKPLKAIMWHPERESPVSNFDKDLVQELFIKKEKQA